MKPLLFHFLTRILNTLFTAALLVPSSGAHAQPPTDPDEAEAYEALLKDIEGLRLDLNRAPAEDLKSLPWLTDDQILQILARRPFHSPQDLRQIPGISPETLDAITPHLHVSRPAPAASRTRWRLTHPRSAPGNFAGLRVYQRTEIEIPGLLEGTLLTEKDPGEPGLADYWSGYLITTGIPGTARVLIGNFRPAFGQGLLFSRRDRTATGIAWAGGRTTRRIGARSSAEDGVLRGLFAETRRGPISGAAFYSRTAWDAVTEADGAAHIRLGGQHITPAERGRKNALKERLAAFRLAWTSRIGPIGITLRQTAWSLPLASDPSPRARSRAAGLDWSLAPGPLALFGEAALGDRDSAWLTGAALRLGALRLVGLARRYGSYFHTLRGNAFSAYSGAPRNETGLFIGGVWTPARGTRIEASQDRHARIRPEGSLRLPGRGQRTVFSISRRASRSLTLDLNLTSSRKTVRTAGHTGPRTRTRIRPRLVRRTPDTRLKLWAEIIRTQSPSGRGHGRAAGVEHTLDRGLDLTLWAALFGVSHADARVYAFTPDVWGGTRLQAFNGRGQACGLRLTRSAGRYRIALRYDTLRTPEGLTASWSVQVDWGTP